MKRFNLTLPDHLYTKALAAAAAREMTLTEWIRRSMEKYLTVNGVKIDEDMTIDSQRD